MKIFITGVSSGLGRELTGQLLKEGHEVWGIGRSGRDKINPSFLNNKNFYYSLCDVSEERQILSATNELMVAGFIPDAVVLNTASLKEDTLDGLTDKSFEEVFMLNVFGVVNFVKVFLPIFKERNKGVFVAISSFSAYIPIIRGETKFAYPASKSAVNMFFDTLRWAFCGTNIKFTVFNFGRMGESKQWFLSVSYQKTAGRIMAYLRAPKGSRSIFYPPLNYIILRAVSFLPYKWLKEIVK